MASHQFQQFGLSIEKRAIRLWAVVAVGAAGAVTLQAWNPVARVYAAAGVKGFRGILSVARTGTGAWTITLDDVYQRLLGVVPTFFSAGGTPYSPVLGVLTSSNVSAVAAPVVNIVFQSAGVAASGSALDPASGEIIQLEIQLQDSSAP